MQQAPSQPPDAESSEPARHIRILSSNFADLVLRETPILGDHLEALAEALPTFTYFASSGIRSENPTARSTAIIRNQSTNDILSLLQLCIAGDGRAAVRTARSVFEHEVNYRTVREEHTEATRYCDQMIAVGPKYLNLMKDFSEKTLSGNQLKSARHQLQKSAKEALRRKLDLGEEYSIGLERNWSTRNLRQRAGRANLEQEYEYYRIFSAVLHGSAIGLLGSHRIYSDSGIVIRTGIAPSLAPIAWDFGLASYRRILQIFGTDLNQQSIQPFVLAIDRLYSASAEFRRTTEIIDDYIWPDDSLEPLVLLRIRVNGTRDWFVYNAFNMTVATAHEPQPQELIENHMRERTQDVIQSGCSQIWVFPQLAQLATRAKWQALSTITEGERFVQFPQLENHSFDQVPLIQDEFLAEVIENIRPLLDDEDA